MAPVIQYLTLRHRSVMDDEYIAGPINGNRKLHLRSEPNAANAWYLSFYFGNQSSSPLLYVPYLFPVLPLCVRHPIWKGERRLLRAYKGARHQRTCPIMHRAAADYPSVTHWSTRIRQDVPALNNKIFSDATATDIDGALHSAAASHFKLTSPCRQQTNANCFFFILQSLSSTEFALPEIAP